MRLIEPSFEIVKNENQLKTVEFCARICYASQDKTTDDSYIRFCKARFGEHHYAIFEHANFTFEIDTFFADYFFRKVQNLYGVNYAFLGNKLLINLNLRHIFELCDKGDYEFYNLLPEHYQMFYENHNSPNMSEAKFKLIGEADIIDGSSFVGFEGNFKDRFTFKTVKLVCQRAIWDELARHRRNALCCQSSRYCAYFKDRFGGEIKYSVPHFLKEADVNQRTAFLDSCKRNEEDYFKLFTLGLPPQDSRDILALGYSVECVVTASVEQWKTIFERRTSKMAHPDIAYLMKQVQAAIIKE